MPNFQMPVPCGETWSGMTSPNNWRYSAVYFNRANDLGDTVVAAASGTVTLGEDSLWGKYVKINHPEVSGVVTMYSHLLGVSVKNGQYVEQGQKIGYVGATGNNVAEPFLGYEVQWWAGMLWNKVGPDQYISDAYTYLNTSAKYPTTCGL